MAWPSLVPPTPGTVITAAWASGQVVDPLTWLRLMTGNADPPGSSYIVVSSSTSATAWGKVTADVLAAGAVVAHLGYTPLNKAGDTTTGPLTVTNTTPGGLATEGTVVFGSGTGAYISRSGSRLYLNAGGGGAVELQSALIVTSTGGLSLTQGNLSVTGEIFVAGSSGQGMLHLGAHTFGFNGAQLVYDGVPIWHSANDGNGSGLDADLWRGLRPDQTTVSAATNAAQVGGRTPTATPTANSIPISNAAGKLDEWVTPTSAAPVPSGLIAFINDGNVPAGWSFYTPANGRVILAAGSAGVTNDITFAVGGNYGSDWAHAHTVNVAHAHTHAATHNHGASALGVTGATAGPSTSGTGGGPGATFADAAHTHGIGTLDVSGTTDGAAPGTTDSAGSTTQGTTAVSWVPPAHALNAVRKN